MVCGLCRLAPLALWLTLAAAVPSSAQPAQASALQEGLTTFDAAWRLVRDTHFDPTFNGLDWNRVREEFRPRAAVARSARELRGVIQDMLDRLGQSHFVLLPSGSVDEAAAPGADQRGGTGLDVRLLDDEVVVTSVRPDSPAAGAGVRAGWVLRAIDGERLAAALARLPATLAPRLRHVEAWRIATTRLLGAPGSTVRLELLDGSGRTQLRSIVRQSEPGEPVTIGNLPTFFVRVSTGRLAEAGATIGTISFNVWMTPVDALFGAAIGEFRATDGVIVDLRGNPGGLAAMLMGISGYFLDEPRVLGTMRTRDNALRFVANPRRVDASGVLVTPYAGRLAILVDGMTGSASECFAGGMQAIGRARVFGQSSMGQALPSLFDKLPNGDVLLHAYGDFQTARGDRLEGHGVAPDERLPLRRDDLLAGRDTTLAAAAAWIARQRK